MAITLRNMFEQTREKYGLRLLAGEETLDHVVTWTHMTEDASVAEFFWGNELVVTGGFSCRDDASLIRFIDTLFDHNCVGVVINTGKYIEKVSPEVIAFCRENQIPLLVMPWVMSITEFVRECCQLISKSGRDDDVLAQEVISCINNPAESSRYVSSLREHFRLEEGFTFLAVAADVPEADTALDRRRTLRLHTAMQPFDFPYLIFHHDMRIFVLLNQTDAELAGRAARQILDTSRSLFPNLAVFIGIGDPFYGGECLADGYLTSVSAVRQASIQRLAVVRFSEMSFYRLLYSVPRDTLLSDYYEKTLHPLLEYDRRHDGCYTETLLRYILSGGSLQQVAAEMYTHRNTVSYRMGKIRELLGDPLETPADYLPYLIAYHSGLILRKLEPLAGV